MSKSLFYYLLPGLIPIAYAETHYRFKYFFSWLRKPEPEIIFDIPSRAKSGNDYPVLLLIKDANQYPVEVHRVQIYSNQIKIFESDESFTVSKSYFEKIFRIPAHHLSAGEVELDCVIEYTSGMGRKRARNDNHRMTSHAPLKTFISAHDLPRIDDCVFGETHSHSNYTSDQVEFGASLTGTAILAKSLGLDYFCVTDHSYDMDDMPDNYLLNDPQLQKWTMFRQEIQHHNHGAEKILIIPGEEITVRNNRGKNVHFLLYNNRKFFKGSGDSAEKWFKTRSENSVGDVLKNMESDALAFAAHPAETVPLLQKIFISRGNWNDEDFADQRLNGMQCVNGAPAVLDRVGKALWVNQLLSGRQLVAIAGNDAHGNFARFRQIGLPFLTMREHYHHLFGVWRTGVFLDGKPCTIESVLGEIKKGNCFMSNGPALRFKVKPVEKESLAISIIAKSTEEFGSLESCRLIAGHCSAGKETQIAINDQPQGYDFTTKQTLPTINDADYLRLEIQTSKNKKALSNAVWLDSLNTN